MSCNKCGAPANGALCEQHRVEQMFDHMEVGGDDLDKRELEDENDE